MNTLSWDSGSYMDAALQRLSKMPGAMQTFLMLITTWKLLSNEVSTEGSSFLSARSFA